MPTPIRDQLGLNDPTAGAGGGYTAEEIVSLRAQKLAQAEMRAALRAGLSTLPAPENEYSIAMPEQVSVRVCVHNTVAAFARRHFPLLLQSSSARSRGSVVPQGSLPCTTRGGPHNAHDMHPLSFC